MRLLICLYENLGSFFVAVIVCCFCIFKQDPTIVSAVVDEKMQRLLVTNHFLAVRSTKILHPPSTHAHAQTKIKLPNHIRIKQKKTKNKCIGVTLRPCMLIYFEVKVMCCVCYRWSCRWSRSCFSPRWENLFLVNPVGGRASAHGCQKGTQANTNRVKTQVC